MEAKEVNQEETSLFKSLRILFGRLLGGHVHFSKEYTGKVLTMEDGRQFEVIRDLRVDTVERSVDSVTLFIVRFKFSGLPLAVNKRISLIPAPFLVAKTGFRRKLWTVSEDGCFQGVYQWATKGFADEYPQSFIFKMMTRRSVEGTVSYEVIPDTVLSEYIENHILS